jgi:16S rRNA (cytosine1402-N4)-methyltransferase
VEHLSVLPLETVALLAPPPKARILDATLGLGGHATALLEAAGPEARLLGLDKDLDSLAEAGRRLARFGDRALLRHADFRAMAQQAAALEPGGFDTLLMDLGVSSPQLDRAERGFSFMQDGPLDMRMDPSQGPTAAEWIDAADEAELTRVLFEYGEEREARRIARAIIKGRPFATTLQLAQAVERAAPRRGERLHPATRTFQALRIAVNDELAALSEALPQALALLKPGGRMAVISFHSLEDRLVKQFMAREAAGCICPPGMPECRCGHRASLKLVTRKPVAAGDAELKSNPRSRSAKLRVAERLPDTPEAS